MKFHPFKGIGAAIRAGTLHGVHTMFGYQGALSKPWRQTPKTTTNSEDAQLPKADRRTLIADTREALRNYPVLQWLVNTNADYVAPHTFAGTNDDDALNDKLESLMKWWSKARNCDIAQRHHLSRMVRMWEIRATIDGDLGILLTNSGALQMIEGDLITTPDIGMPEALKKAIISQGVILGREGQAKRYVLVKREAPPRFGTPGTQLKYDRTISAANTILFGHWDNGRFDSVRAVSPLSTVVTGVKDLGEAMIYANTKMKNHQLFGIAITREVDPISGIGEFETTDADTDVAGTENTTQYQYELKNGLKLDLPPGAKIDTIESKQPSNEFQAYLEQLTHFVISSLGVPMTFWDSGEASMSSMRQDLNRYIKATAQRKRDIQEVLNRITAWKIATWATAKDPVTGEAMLPLPDKMLPRDVKYEWLPDGIPFVDPLKEVSAKALAVANGFTTRDSVARQSYNTRFTDNATQLGKEEQQAVDASATIVIGQPGQISTRDEEGGNEANETGGDGNAE